MNSEYIVSLENRIRILEESVFFHEIRQANRILDCIISKGACTFKQLCTITGFNQILVLNAICFLQRQDRITEFGSDFRRDFEGRHLDYAELEDRVFTLGNRFHRDLRLLLDAFSGLTVTVSQVAKLLNQSHDDARRLLNFALSTMLVSATGDAKNPVYHIGELQPT